MTVRVLFLLRICQQGYLRFSAVGLVSFPSNFCGVFCCDSMSLHFADCFVEFFHVLRSFVCSCCGGFYVYVVGSHFVSV